MPVPWCYEATTCRRSPTTRTISRPTCRRWPVHPRVPTEALSSWTDSVAANCLPRNQSAKFVLIRIPSRPSTTSWVTARSRSSPSPDRTSIAPPPSGILPTSSGIREIPINQNPFSPEYDKLGYGKIEIFTKPGSDKYRATAQWNFANEFWNSRNSYSSSKEPFLLNEFEGREGGPLTKRSNSFNR